MSNINLLFSAANVAAENTPKNPLDKKKYEFTGETMEFDGHILRRIRLLGDARLIESIKGKYKLCRQHHVLSGTDEISQVENSTGMTGGWIEKESNLSQSGLCFIFGNAKVYDDAVVEQHAMIMDEAIVCNNAKVYNEAVVENNAKVYDNVQIGGTASVSGNATIRDNVKIYGCAAVMGISTVADNVKVYDHAIITNSTFIHGDTKVCGHAIIDGIHNNRIVEIEGGVYNGTEID